MHRLTEALMVAQERLAESRTEYETATQELRAANEELQSINEEYRSTSEELETSKEELQSMNEELQTVNSELKLKLESISSAHNDLRNLMSATEIGTLFLDPDLRIKLFTPAASNYFNITDSDIGRVITDFTHRLVYDAIESDVAKVLRDLVPIEAEIKTRDERWLMMRLRPYRTIENRIDGVVLTLFDITARRRAEAELRGSEERYRSLFESMDEGFLVAQIDLDASGQPKDLLFTDANPAAERLIPGGLTGRRLKEISPEFEPAWIEIPARVDRSGKPESHELFAHPLGRWFEVHTSVISGQSHSVAMLLQDVTERRSWEVAQRRLVGELNHRVKNMLTIVQSIASQTQKSTADPEQFNVAFAKRLRALGEVHDILTVQGWVGADLEEMTKKALGSLVGVGDPRVRIKGPAVHLSPNATIAMSMVIHELATNAIKYGSLSDPSGKVQITWEAKDDRSGKSKVYMSWIESGGPKVERPTSSGFGMRLLTEALAYELDGVAHLDFKDTGLVCRIEFSSGDDVAGQ